MTVPPSHVITIPLDRIEIEMEHRQSMQEVGGQGWEYLNFQDYILNCLVHRIHGFVFATQPKVVEFTHPATWWDHARRDLGPAWFRHWHLLRWPIRTQTDRVEVQKLCLDIQAPPGRTVVHVAVHEGFR